MKYLIGILYLIITAPVFANDNIKLYCSHLADTSINFRDQKGRDLPKNFTMKPKVKSSNIALPQEKVVFLLSQFGARLLAQDDTEIPLAYVSTLQANTMTFTEQTAAGPAIIWTLNTREGEAPWVLTSHYTHDHNGSLSVETAAYHCQER